MWNRFPGVAPLAQGGPRAAAPPAPVSRTPQLLWRPQAFRVELPGTSTTTHPVVPLYNQRSLAVGLEIFADVGNVAIAYVGSKLVSTPVSSPDGISGNNYWQLSPGQHVYVYTDSPETESFDVGMFFAVQGEPLVSIYLHCTQWQPQPL